MLHIVIFFVFGTLYRLNISTSLSVKNWKLRSLCLSATHDSFPFNYSRLRYIGLDGAVQLLDILHSYPHHGNSSWQSHHRTCKSTLGQSSFYTSCCNFQFVFSIMSAACPNLDKPLIIAIYTSNGNSTSWGAHVSSVRGCPHECSQEGAVRVNGGRNAID